MKRILLIGSGNTTDLFLEKLQRDIRFEICGLLPDPVNRVESKYYQKVKREVPVFNQDTLSDSKADIIFAIEYRKLLPQKVVNDNMILNCHAGILPRYRGFSANAWGIMNGERYIGYSIHEMNEKMDDGLLYYVKKIPIRIHETYADVHKQMIDSIISDVPDVLLEIAEGALEGTEQKGERIYGHKFTKEMGVIENYCVESAYIYNLYRCMARPLGTGIKIKYGGRLYDVNRVAHGRERNVCDYLGIPGMIVNIDVDEIWVKTLDNVIIFKELVDEDGQTVDVGQIFRIGNRLML